jgi:hypothetical protein
MESGAENCESHFHATRIDASLICVSPETTDSDRQAADSFQDVLHARPLLTMR